MSTARVTAAVLIIGNEVLSGRTQDANLAYLATGLNRIGIQVREARVIPDVESLIVETVNTLRAAHDYVLTTGGIGPTHDDITAASVAKAFGVPLDRNPEAVRLLEAHYADPKVPFKLNEARLRMANIPRGAALLLNPVSKAPGFRIENVYVLPGVPSIMRAMFDAMKHGLQGGAEVLSEEIPVHLPEGDLAEALGDLQARYPDVDMGSYPFFRDGRYGTSLVLRCTDSARLEAAAAELTSLIEALRTAPPEVSPPEGSPPEVSPPEVSPPEVSPPEVSPPEVRS